jgi:phosphoglycerol transferase
MELWNADLDIPFRYTEDTLWNCMSIKGVIDNGWYLHNNFVGMPTGLDIHDFPSPDVFNFLLIKIISFFNSNYAFVMNFYFLLTFPLTTLAALFVFRNFHFSYAPSIVVSLLFTFLPYHFMRGEKHLFLASYFTIPLMVMVILWVFSDDNILFSHNKDKDSLKFEFNFKSLACFVICLIVASTGIYYAFFACIFLIIAGIRVLIARKRKYSFLAVETLITVIIIGVLINILPNIVYVYNHGMNAESLQRSPVEAEYYAMKIDQLILPVDGHRIEYMSDFKERYNEIAPFVNENTSSSLGIMGSIGFLLLISRLFWKTPQNHTMELSNNLTLLNLSAVLLATVGGFGYFIALIVPGIRSYNRISIYIAFFSLFAVNMLLENLYQKYKEKNFQRYLYYGFLGLLLTIGVLDQTNKTFVPQYELIKSEYINDSEFINKVESSLPEYTMIFQLPYMSFPENLQFLKMGDYQLFRGYIHSKTLRWSYGTMKGREGDRWQRVVTSRPTDEFLKSLSTEGFQGVYVDREGYEDSGAGIEAELKRLLDTEPIISANNRLAFYSMEEYNKKLNDTPGI